MVPTPHCISLSPLLFFNVEELPFLLIMVWELGQIQEVFRRRNVYSYPPCCVPQVEELPFLLTKAGELGRLKECVRDLEVFRRLNQSEDGYFELVKAWKTVSTRPLSRDLDTSSISAILTKDSLIFCWKCV